MRLDIELRCVLFPLIILEMFLQLDWSPPVANSIDWTWFGKGHTYFYKVPQLTVHVRVKTKPWGQGNCASTQSCLGTLRTIPLTSWLWFLLWHALSTVEPYIDRCVPFQIMSNQLNLSKVHSNQVVETSQGWSMESYISSLIAKSLNTCVTFVCRNGPRRIECWVPDHLLIVKLSKNNKQ